jgi:hypothetical protein
MSQEVVGKQEKGRLSRWLARAVGVTAIASALLVPACTPSPEATAKPVDNAITAEIPESKLSTVTEQPPPAPRHLGIFTRDTGMDMQSCFDFEVCGTDLGEPFTLPPNPDGTISIGYLFGDTFKVAGPFLEDVPSGENGYRPQTMLRSNMTPVEGQPIIFDNAAGLQGKGIAPELLYAGHSLPNDAVSHPESGEIFVSYQHIIEMNAVDAYWRTDRASLAVSYNGNSFETKGPVWENNPGNTDPFQMWSMQRDGEFVYIVSVRAGRQPGPMMLFRVPWGNMLDQNAYKYWNGSGWGVKEQATPILDGDFGEPSLRKLSDGTWVMGYTDYSDERCSKIVTRTILDQKQGPEGKWSDPKVQKNCVDMPGLYGGFIHPRSTSDNLILMISAWQAEKDGTKHGILKRYDVSHLVTTTS